MDISKSGEIRDRVVALKVTNPKMTLRKIAEEVGITFQGVAVILKCRGLSTSTQRNLRCFCGKSRLRLGKNSYSSYCSEECRITAKAERHNKTLVTLICQVCVKEFLVKRSDIEYGKRQGLNRGSFCSPSCTGKWVRALIREKQTHCDQGHSLEDAYDIARKEGSPYKLCRLCSVEKGWKLR